MSTKKKKAPATGVRYTDAQKKEIVNFVSQYNKTNGRGGQSAAAKKYNVTPLTISGWLKAAGVKAPAAKKVVKKVAKKAAKKAAKSGKGGKGIRYADDFKKQVVDFVTSYNESKGRGGQNQAAKKFKLSVLTVASWLNAAGVKKPASKKKITAKVNKVEKAAKKVAKKVANKVAKASGDLAAFKAELLKLIKSF
jgi:transposase-like protein